MPNVIAPNIAREVSLIPLFPKTVDAYSVSRACASANQAITNAVDQIILGHHDTIIAGWAEALSNVPILHSRGFSDALVAASRAKSLAARVQAIAKRAGPSVPDRTPEPVMIGTGAELSVVVVGQK